MVAYVADASERDATMRPRRVCTDCGSTRWHIEQVTAEEALRP